MIRLTVIYRRIRKELGHLITRRRAFAIAWDIYMDLPFEEWRDRLRRERTIALEAKWEITKSEIIVSLIEDEIAREDDLYGIAI